MTPGEAGGLQPADAAFARRALARGPLFLGLAVAGVAIGLGLAAYYGYRRFVDPGFPLGMRAVLVVLILLNARQNLRQWRYVRVLRAVSATIPGADDRDAACPGASARGVPGGSAGAP